MWGFGNSPIEKGRWEYTAISWDFVPRGAQWGSSGEKSQEEPGRERERGVREIVPGVVLGERRGVGVLLKIGLE